MIINVHIEGDLAKRFREKIFTKYGIRKGNIKKCIEESIELWLANE